MTTYEKPIAEVIDFNSEEIMNGSGNAGVIGSTEEGTGTVPGMGG